MTGDLVEAVGMLGLVVTRIAFLVAVGCAMAFQLRHREDRSTPQARRLRAGGLWAVAVGVLGLAVYALAG